MIDIYILGTSHDYQCGGEKLGRSKHEDKFCSRLEVTTFRNELRTICKSNNILRIAEEMTAHGRARRSVKKTIGAKVARELEIEHHEVDLSPKERKSISLTDAPLINVIHVFNPADCGSRFRDSMEQLFADVRERVWAARIIEKPQWPVLFICGADHVDSFSKIITLLGFDQEILHRDYKPCI